MTKLLNTHRKLPCPNPPCVPTISGSWRGGFSSESSDNSNYQRLNRNPNAKPPKIKEEVEAANTLQKENEKALSLAKIKYLNQ